MGYATIPQAVTAYRHASSRLHRLAGSTGATTNAAERHGRRIAAAVATLTDAGRRDLVTALREESQLTVRLAAARRLGQTRPELAARLTAARAKLKDAVR